MKSRLKQLKDGFMEHEWLPTVRVAASGTRGSIISIIDFITQLFIGPELAKTYCTRLANNTPPKPAHYNTANPLDSPPNHQHRISTAPFSQLTNFVMKPDSHKLLEKVSRDAVMSQIH
jgi:hypothetical protein